MMLLRCELLKYPGSVLDLCGIRVYFGCDFVYDLFGDVPFFGEFLYVGGLSGAFTIS